MARSALVIGGGLLGVTSAWYLAERGFKVTLLERRAGTGLETSYANGGLVTPSQSDPWNAPGTFGLLLRWLWREDSPLLLRPRALPGMWRWGLKFLLASRAAPWWAATEANLRLGLYSAACLRQLRGQLGLQYQAMSVGTLKVFRDAAFLERSDTLARSLAPLGLKHRVLDRAEAVALEPMLEAAAGLTGAIHYSEDESGDAHAFTRALEQHARAAGVEFLTDTEVTGFTSQAGEVAGVITSRGGFQAETYVLAAGPYSPALAATLGLDLPIYPVKGYSVTLKLREPKRRLGIPLVDFERKFVVTPLGGRLRIAGTAEFTGFDTSPNPRRGAAVLKHALELLPEVAGQVEGVEHWTGLRPMSCDGPPLVGATRYPNLYINAGHGPLGLTLAAGSSRALADLMAGRAPELDLAGYSPGRFSR